MSPQSPYPIVDIHTHLMPERLFRAVRAYFRAHLWHPRYDAPTEDLVQSLLAVGIRRFVFMPYAHRAGMSRSLNHWVANVQATFAPNAIGFGTFHPDDAELLPELVDEAFIQLGLTGAKLHPQVGRFAVDDPRLDPLYERAVESGALRAQPNHHGIIRRIVDRKLQTGFERALARGMNNRAGERAVWGPSVVRHVPLPR